ncbi:TolC family protein [Hankyongella ginsenosidimutans]|uniref:TolC family protein n=1 Tax=Hankyongella ginsenosidimutans TaxID=1763828 RepID=A0A4D7CBM8_9SPHN|nr:TolC family protein [Hankyongella ginsenosidimutans]
MEGRRRGRLTAHEKSREGKDDDDAPLCGVDHRHRAGIRPGPDRAGGWRRRDAPRCRRDRGGAIIRTCRSASPQRAGPSTATRWTRAIRGAAGRLDRSADALARGDRGRRLGIGGASLAGEGKALRTYAGRVDNAAQSGLDAARLRIAGEVRTAWWGLAAARAAVAVDRAQVDIATTNAAQVARLERAGEQSRRDLLLAQAEASTARSRLSQAESALADAEAAFAVLAGTPPADLPAEALATATDVASNPALRAALDRAALADARYRSLAYAARVRPEGTLGVRRERGGVGDPTVPREPFRDALLVGIRVPLGRNQTAVADAELARSEALSAAAEANRLRMKLMADQRAAQTRLDAAQRAFEQAQMRRDALAASQALTERGRAEGEIGFIEVLRGVRRYPRPSAIWRQRRSRGWRRSLPSIKQWACCHDRAQEQDDVGRPDRAGDADDRVARSGAWRRGSWCRATAAGGRIAAAAHGGDQRQLRAGRGGNRGRPHDLDRRFRRQHAGDRRERERDARRQERCRDREERRLCGVRRRLAQGGQA